VVYAKQQKRLYCNASTPNHPCNLFDYNATTRTRRIRFAGVVCLSEAQPTEKSRKGRRLDNGRSREDGELI
jgi:hypothetical protein